MRASLLAAVFLVLFACNPLSSGGHARSAVADGRDERRPDDAAELEALLRAQPTLAPLVDDAYRRRLQVLVAVPVDDEAGSPTLRRLGYRVDAEYFYPASAVKLAIGAAALQKVEELALDGATPLRVFERDGGRLRTFETTLLNDLERSLVVSDNEANNRLFELVGRDELAERISKTGLTSTRIVHRLGEPSPRKEYAFELAPEGKAPVAVGQRLGGAWPAPRVARTLVGTAYIDESGSLVNGPMSFEDKNWMSLRDLQDLLVAVARPELAPEIDLRLSEVGRRQLLETLGTAPSESRRLGSPRGLDEVHKPLLGAVSSAVPHHRVRVYGKGGRAYGFTVECSYVVDETSGRSVFVAAALYANDNGTLNDDRYQYEDVAAPFITGLGRLIAQAYLAPESSD